MVVLGGGAVSYERGTPAPTRWSTALSSKVNLPHAINFRALIGASLVTLPSKFGGAETFVLLRYAGLIRGQRSGFPIRSYEVEEG